MIDPEIIRIRSSVVNGLSPEDACYFARAFDEMKMLCHALREENAELRKSLAHLEGLRERDLGLTSTLPPDAPDTVSVDDPLKFDKEGV